MEITEEQFERTKNALPVRSENARLSNLQAHNVLLHETGPRPDMDASGGELPTFFPEGTRIAMGMSFSPDQLNGLYTSSTPRQPSPAQHEPAPAPTDNRLRLRNHERALRIGSESPQGQPKETVRSIGYQLPMPRLQGPSCCRLKSQGF
jgi:hypothetical protein